MLFRCRAKQFVLLTATFVAVLTGCSKQKTTGVKFTIGFSQCIGSDLWRKTMLDEIKMELSLHPGSDLIYADAEGDNQKQIRQVSGMLQHGIDLLIISPNEARPLTGIVEQAYSKGIPVIVIDRKTNSNLYTAYVGADNYQVGKMAAQYLVTLLKGRGRILQVTGLPGSSPAMDREKGFEEAFKNAPGIQLKQKIAGDWLKDSVTSILRKQPDALKDVDAVFAQNDVMAEGVRQMVNAQQPGRPIMIIGVDALPGSGGGLQMVSNHTTDASLLYPTGGKEAIITAFRILNHESYARENILQSVVIDSSNVQLMKLQWNRISNQQRDIERQQSLLEEQKAIYRNQEVILNVVVITLVLAIICGGLAFYSLIDNRKINNSLERKNQQILQQKNELMEMSVKAEAATEAKLNFFTNISHEFRTPLTLMLGPVEDLLNQKKPLSPDHKNLGLIYKNIFVLLKLVNQLIDYRKIEYDKKQISASQNDLVVFITEITGHFRHLAKSRKIDLRFVHDMRSCDLWFDINLLDKVFFNLISNSFRFVNDGGHIYIRLFSQEEHIIIEVEDNGIGMSEDQAAQYSTISTRPTARLETGRASDLR
jgi:ABC-type sugar transport system substrate-binding protein